MSVYYCQILNPWPKGRFGHALDDDDELPAADYLVHLDSLIDFLEIYEREDGEPRGILNLVPRQQG